MPDLEGLTDQQKKWFASIRAGLEPATGRSLEQWTAIARSCPETSHRARLAWLKTHHGLLQNRASLVLGEAFPKGAMWSEPGLLRDALWSDPAARAILERVEAAVLRLTDVVAGQRKGYSAWSRKAQFAALRPIKGGTAVLGLALPPDAHPLLQPAKNDGWSERLKGRVGLGAPDAVTGEIEALLQQAWARS